MCPEVTHAENLAKAAGSEAKETDGGTRQGKRVPEEEWRNRSISVKPAGEAMAALLWLV